eukprot:TRINITY_DN793_c0_g1_i1.p1 TRINITY_DN793_c0_g1~~TRINITY_DN793_c0_g1_i1.p1  ORF type:complete len:199 (-),score=66.51 TRINITY_DN793_c0_g1_i1:59-655(-)
MGLEVFTQRNEQNGPILGEGEEMLYQHPHTSFYIQANNISEGDGTLFITSKRVIWMDGQSKGYVIDFPYISLHAISRDTSHFPHPCIYCQLDSDSEPVQEDSDDDDENGGTMTDDVSNDVDLSTISEARYVVSDPASLGTVFDAFSRGAAMNPDSEQEGEGDFFYDQEEIQRGISDHLDSVLEDNTSSQFEDNNDMQQ